MKIKQIPEKIKQTIMNVLEYELFSWETLYLVWFLYLCYRKEGTIILLLVFWWIKANGVMKFLKVLLEGRNVIEVPVKNELSDFSESPIIAKSSFTDPFSKLQLMKLLYDQIEYILTKIN